MLSKEESNVINNNRFLIGNKIMVIAFSFQNGTHSFIFLVVKYYGRKLINFSLLIKI